MHSVPNDLNTNILSAEVNEVEKFIKYFFVCAFCSKLAATGKFGMVNMISVSHCSKNLNFRNPIFIENAVSQIAEKVFKFSYSDAKEIWPNLCVSKDVFNNNEDALTETILNFRNVEVVLGKEYVTMRAGQPKSKQHMHLKCRNGTILHSIVVYSQIKTEIY